MDGYFRRLPKGLKLNPTNFEVRIDQDKLDELRILIHHSKIAPATYESTQSNRALGISPEWLREAREQWLRFDWREVESYINSFPNYKVKVSDCDTEFDIHFCAIFSNRDDAIPVLMMHGWPGSFMEFFSILKILMTKYSPETLPYHVVVPSLPGYAFSSSPPLDRDFRLEDVARIMDQVMCNLGFEDGYVVQGGDVGSKVARVLGGTQPRAKAVHLNLCIMPDPGSIPESEYSEKEKIALHRAREFARMGIGYAIEQATKPATIGAVLSANPVAMLAWIGEKLLDWTDEDPSIDTILEAVTLYWLTDCFPTAIYTYRQVFTPGNIGAHENPAWYIKRPLGFSWFPKELAPVPRAWVATTGNLVFWRDHDAGGHFAAMEQPAALLDDFEEFVAQVWPSTVR